MIVNQNNNIKVWTDLNNIYLKIYEYDGNRKLIKKIKHNVRDDYFDTTFGVQLQTNPNTTMIRAFLYLASTSPRKIQLDIGGKVIQFGDSLQINDNGQHVQLQLKNQNIDQWKPLLCLPKRQTPIKIGIKKEANQMSKFITFHNKNLPFLYITVIADQNSFIFPYNQSGLSCAIKRTNTLYSNTIALQEETTTLVETPSSSQDARIDSCCIHLSSTEALQSIEMYLNNSIIKTGDTLTVQLSENREYISVLNQNNNLIAKSYTGKGLICV